MGWNLRRSKKLFPGVRLNLSKKGLGLSVGPRHSKISLSPLGRVTANLGIPGTGIRYTKRVELGKGAKPMEASAKNLIDEDIPLTTGYMTAPQGSLPTQFAVLTPSESDSVPSSTSKHIDIPGEHGALETEIASCGEDSLSSREDGEDDSEEFIRKYAIVLTARTSTPSFSDDPSDAYRDHSGLVDLNMLRQYARAKNITRETRIFDTYTGLEHTALQLLGFESFPA